MKLVALKRLRYPRGPGGKEYVAGDPFEVSSDRDAKALKLVRAAEDAPVAARPGKAPAPAPAVAPVAKALSGKPDSEGAPAKAPAVEAPKTQDGPVAPVSTESADALVPGRSGRYRRSDMRPQE